MKSATRAATNIVHVITGLEVGGAEMMLYQLLAHMDRADFPSEVISLTDVGPVGEKIRGLGIPVRALGMGRSGPPDPRLLLRLARWLRAARPQVVQTWMYHADLLGALAARAAGSPPVVWNIQYGGFHPDHDKRSTVLTARLCARLSRRLPRRIVSCSAAAREEHGRLGYDRGKITVIPNAADTDAFRPDREARRAVREELGLCDDTPLIGMAGRFNPQKDHRNFVRAAVRLHQDRPDAHFLLCGLDVAWDNPAFSEWVPPAMRGRFRLLGRRPDVARLAAALDVGSLSSAYGEGFPMALNELMACGVPCAATDVGDCALLVGDTGRIVPPRDPEALAGAWRDLLDMGGEGRRRLGALARRRVETHFDIRVIAARYGHLYAETAGGQRAASGEGEASVCVA